MLLAALGAKAFFCSAGKCVIPRARSMRFYASRVLACGRGGLEQQQQPSQGQPSQQPLQPLRRVSSQPPQAAAYSTQAPSSPRLSPEQPRSAPTNEGGGGGGGYIHDLPTSTSPHAPEVFPTPCSSGRSVPHRRRSVDASRVAACHPGALAARALACFAVSCTVAGNPANSTHRSHGVAPCSATAIVPARTATWQWCCFIQLC